MKLLFLCLFILSHSAVHARQTPSATISGVVMDSDQTPIASATVVLHQHTDETIIKIDISDSDGQYSLENLDAGIYYMRISYIGYETVQSPLIELDPNTQHKADPVILHFMTSDLETVAVTARAPIAVTSPDRTVINIDQLISSQGGTVLDILNQSPGVFASQNGAISIRGNSSVLVLMDDRQIRLEGAELTEFLQGMASDQIHQIEVITQPSARYEAQGTGGIINLKTKQGLTNGFNGNISTGIRQGRTFSTVNNLDVNWKRNQLNLSANYGFVHANPVLEMLHLTTIRDENNLTEATLDKKFLSESTTDTHNFRTDLDYIIRNTSMGFTYQGNLRYFPGQKTETHSTIFYPQSQISASTESTRERSMRNPMHTFSFYTNHHFNQEESTFSFVADYLNFQRPITYHLNSSGSVSGLPDSDNTSLIRQQMPSDIRIYGLKGDLTHSLSPASAIEAGFKATFMKMDNNAIFELFDPPTNQFITDPERSTHYIFDEHIYAAYITLSQQFGDRTEAQAGVRTEYIYNDGEELNRKETFGENKIQLFPNITLTRHLNERHILSAGFFRRTNRPNYELLIPFSYYTDLLYYQRGNPRLKPEIDNTVELTHIYKGKLTSTLSYTLFKDAFVWTQNREMGNPAIFQSYSNFDQITTYDISLHYMDQITPWYLFMVNAIGGYDHYSGMLDDDYLSVRNTYRYVQFLNQFHIAGGWTMEASGILISSWQDGPFSISRPMTQINVNIAKQILNGQGSLRLMGADIFDSYRYSTSSQLRVIDAVMQQRTFDRQFGISFSYRFGSGQRLRTNKPTSSTSEETERL